MFPISQIIKVSNRKFSKNKIRSLFVILPVAFLVMVVFLATSETKSLSKIVEDKIFSFLEDRSKIINLSNTFTSLFSGEDSMEFTDEDLESIKNITNVQSAELLYPAPIKNIKALAVFEDKDISLYEMAGLGLEFAAQYTDKPFEYHEDKPIPIILSMSDFSETYEDWQGKDKIEISYNEDLALGTSEEKPIKRKVIQYEKDELIGKVISIHFGGLEDFPTFKKDYDYNREKVTYTKISKKEIDKKVKDRKESLSKYFDYEKISAEIKFDFVILGIEESRVNRTSYVPKEFADELTRKYFENYNNARNNKKISQNELDNLYQGLERIEGRISKPCSQSEIFLGVDLEGLTPSTGEDQEEYLYYIPGLVTTLPEKSDLPVEYNGKLDLSKEIPVEKNTILIQINDGENREQVLNDLNNMGYEYADLSFTGLFGGIRNVFYKILNFLVAIFMFIGGIIILITMGKFVSDSRKEIGVFRAIGATKNDIRKIFIGQAIYYVFIGYLLGVILGGILMFALSSRIGVSVNNVLGEIIGSVLPFTIEVTWKDFISVDIVRMGVFSLVLFGFTFFVSLIPANNASKVSPIEAIRNE